MSESREREKFREEQAKRQAELNEKKIQNTVAEIQKSYGSMKALFPEENPAAWTAILKLRARIRRMRQQWLEKMVDPKIAREQKDIILGQYHACMLAFDILKQTRELYKGMVPGKEMDFVRERLFKNQQQQRGAEHGQ